MAERFEVYQCGVCGNVVGMLIVGGGQLTCCNQPMNLHAEKSADQGMEKHVPVIEDVGEGIKVKVGDVPHPMADDHFIQWIETVSENGDAKLFLSPGDTPEREFRKSKKLKKVRAYCNLHGLWTQEV
jgi:superoxide reductase